MTQRSQEFIKLQERIKENASHFYGLQTSKPVIVLEVFDLNITLLLTLKSKAWGYCTAILMCQVLIPCSHIQGTLY